MQRAKSTTGRRPRLLLAVALLSSHALAGCSLASLSGAESTPLPATTKILDELPRVSNSPKAPCWQQVEIAAQNSYLASVKASRNVVYTAPCKAQPEQPPPASEPPPRTS